ncbi:hypothetical protein [Thiothrix nivea]|uniref:Uncharacterized protein n=1 Tax=Thiothrix nivea (strain ATCC 35100 / DSM 5205 / JP2) TaxID=870187 RepID=A0A656HIL8_THINJ|nr:hypothetical protein [Thiothrix nivea]EIJ35230.1 hypothetical protein Thini_2693 [Thiothrix nivea DSM 5205]
MNTDFKRLLPALLLVFAAHGVWAEENWQAASPEATGDGACLLSTPKQTINDGQGDTKVWLEVDKTAVVVRTQSSIDPEFKDIGLQVDQETFLPFDEVRNETDLVFAKDIQVLTQQFIKGHSVTVSARFWPTWPTTGVKTIPFSLIGFTKAYQEGCGAIAEPPEDAAPAKEGIS